MSTQPGTFPPPEHQTLSVVDSHYLGEDGLPTRHHTVQRIRALDTLEGPMTRFPYRFDTNAVAVNVLLGGVATELYRAAEGIHAVDIKLDVPLWPGDEVELEYETSFAYRKPPPPEFRRSVGSHTMERLGITVVFNDHCLPAHVQQTEWDGYVPGSNIREVIPVQLVPSRGPGKEVRLNQTEVHDMVIGFRWQWAESA